LEGDLHPGLTMATVVQNLDYEATVFPYRQDIGFERNAGYQGAVPFGQAIVNEDFTLDSVGAGDVGSANIGIKLPSNYCAMLRSVHMNAHSGNQSVYSDGVLGLAYQDPGGPYKNTMAALPEEEYLFWPFVASELQYVYGDGFGRYLNSWSIASKTTNTTAQTNPPGADSPLNVPLWVSPNYPGHTALIILNATTTGFTTPCRFNMTFDLYTFEAAFAAGVMSNPRTTST
jgi:hypothetical protein